MYGALSVSFLSYEGKELQSHFRVKGPDIKLLLEHQVALQIEHPGLTVEGCITLLQEAFPEFCST
jgi:hypothetical protein